MDTRVSIKGVTAAGYFPAAVEVGDVTYTIYRPVEFDARGRAVKMEYKKVNGRAKITVDVEEWS